MIKNEDGTVFNNPNDPNAPGPSAKVILDSVGPNGARLTTMEVVCHRFILAEFNTHRAFSRNSASSRAIPVSTQIKRVLTQPAWPIYWGKEQKGMQSGEEFDIDDIAELGLDVAWKDAADQAVDSVQRLSREGLHKSLCNRLLEPFMWHTIIVSATEWDNFFHQRCDPAAQPEMKALADAMQFAYYTSKPRQIRNADKNDIGCWHLPYIDAQDHEEASEMYLEGRTILETLREVSVARCARVSYLQHDGTRAMGKDLELYGKLINGGHWSPFEHVGLAQRSTFPKVWSGNFFGWSQWRHWSGMDTSRKLFIPNLPELAHLRGG